MLDMPLETYAPPAIEHVLLWNRFTVERSYFSPIPSEKNDDAALPNTSKEEVHIKPSSSSSSVILNRLRTFAGWTENWDGEGAAAPNLEAIDIASKFLSLWLPSKIEPEIVLTHDGLPMFVINNGEMIGEIVVNSNRTLDYFFEYADGSMKGDEAISFETDRKPSLLRELALA